MAAMLALDGRYLQRIGGSVSWIHGLIGLSGPYVLTPNSDVLKQIFAAPNTIADWQPIQFVSAASPATLLLHGSADERVVPGHAERLIAALRALGVPAELKIYVGAKHADTVASISLAARGRTPARVSHRATATGNSLERTAAVIADCRAVQADRTERHEHRTGRV